MAGQGEEDVYASVSGPSCPVAAAAIPDAMRRRAGMRRLARVSATDQRY